MAETAGLEPATSGLGTRRSIRLSHVSQCGLGGWTRTSNFRLPGPTLSLLSYAQLSLDADYLLEGVNNVNQVFLGPHNGVNWFIRSWRFINNPGVLSALDPSRCLGMIV